MKLIIEDDEGRRTIVPFVREEITVGRQEGNTIRLTERNVSRSHARLLRTPNEVFVEDLGSYNGVRINGEKIQGRQRVKAGDLIQIGDYDLALQHDTGVGARPPSPPPLNELSNPNARLLDDETVTSESTVDSPILPTSVDTEITAAEQHPIDSTQAPRLVILNTEFGGREFACIRSVIQIGRGSDNDISLDHRSLSRAHAKLQLDDQGTWRVVDLQSANGIAVNGAPASERALVAGDVITFGHVQAKFLEAGQSFEYHAPDTGTHARKGRRRGWLLAVGATTLSIAIGAIWILQTTPDSPPPPPPPTAEQLFTEQLPKRIAEAQAAIEAEDLQRASTLLKAMRAPDGSSPLNVTALLSKVESELVYQRLLESARQLLEQNQPDEALHKLAQMERSALFGGQRDELRAQAEALRDRPTESASAQPVVRQVQVSPRRPEPPVAKAPPSTPASLLNQGIAQLKLKQFAEAASFLRQCVDHSPGYARCHLYLGAAYAKLRDIERGAEHYRTFLSLAPDDPEAAKVRAILEQYEDSQSSAP